MHNICYADYPERIPEKKITEEILRTVAHSGDRYGTDRISFRGATVFDNRDAAMQYIESIDKDFYGGYAVKYYDFSEVKDSKKIEELKKKINETVAKQNEFVAAHSVRKQKAAFIGCSECGSKLNRELLRSERCPLCHEDLRSVSTLERIQSFNKRIAGYRSQIDQERLKEKKKAKIMWLVKYEYHS